MKVAIVYDSRTGNTQAAAEQIAQLYRERGHEVVVSTAEAANPAEVARADVVCIGSWTQGLFVVLQHATEATLRFVSALPALAGKEAVVFCSYGLSSGKLLPNLAKLLRAKGARVSFSLPFRGRAAPPALAELAASIKPSEKRAG
ncbi:MAG: flavodoxin family protein [Myxococcales bacterium]